MTSSIESILTEQYNINNFYPGTKENSKGGNLKMSGLCLVPSDKIVSLTDEM